LIERFYHEMWDRFDKTLIPVVLTEDVRFRGSLGQNKNGHAEFAEYVDFVQRAFPDFTNEIEELISEGDKAFARLTYRGSHRGEVFGIAPTGRRIQYAGAAVFSFRGDKITEVWVLGDIYGLISQLQSPAPRDGA
jgi:predicted ester cyclase